jgi:hypothetical protein
MMEEIRSSKHPFIQESHDVTSLKTAFFIVLSVKTLKFYIALTGWSL